MELYSSLKDSTCYLLFESLYRFIRHDNTNILFSVIYFTDKFYACGTITLIHGRRVIIVDTGLPADKDLIINGKYSLHNGHLIYGKYTV